MMNEQCSYCCLYCLIFRFKLVTKRLLENVRKHILHLKSSHPESHWGGTNRLNVSSRNINVAFWGVEQQLHLWPAVTHRTGLCRTPDRTLSQTEAVYEEQPAVGGSVASWRVETLTVMFFLCCHGESSRTTAGRFWFWFWLWNQPFCRSELLNSVSSSYFCCSYSGGILIIIIIIRC